MHRMALDPDDANTATMSGHEFPEPIRPMLATLATPADVGEQDDWAFEMKWDGVRVVVYLAAAGDGDPRRVRLQSRKGRDETPTYPDLIDDLAAIECESAILDGEIVVLDATARPDSVSCSRGST